MLDVTRQTRGDTKEGYYMGREVSMDHPDASKPLHGPNVWPDPSEEDYAAQIRRVLIEQLVASAGRLQAAYILLW